MVASHRCDTIGRNRVKNGASLIKFEPPRVSSHDTTVLYVSPAHREGGGERPRWISHQELGLEGEDTPSFYKI
jgi:hypothetical protein